MGSGKTSVATELSKQISKPFIDLDNFIEKSENSSIKKIFQKYGEIHFRNKERLYLEKIINSNSPSIISLGGGTPCYFNNMKLLKSKGNVCTFFLKVSPENLSKRLFNERMKRPLISHIHSLKSLEKYVSKHLFERMPYYIQSDYQIDTSNKSISEIAVNILDLLR